jgi:hypothetical protein
MFFWLAVLTLAVQARPAHCTPVRRTPVAVHLTSWASCDTADTAFIAGFEGAFSADSLAIKGSTHRTAIANRFRRARSGEGAAVDLFIVLRWEGSEKWDRPPATDTTTSNHDAHVLITVAIDRHGLFGSTTHHFRARLWSGDMDRADFCWRSGRNIGLVALEALHRDSKKLEWNEPLALMPIVRMYSGADWVREEPPPKHRKGNVLADTTLAFHWKPGVWFMLMRVDCDREDGMEAVITDPNGKVLCPLRNTTSGATVANKCDCIAFNMGPREGGRGSSFVDASAWHPQRGPYRIQVTGLAPCRIVVSGGAQFSPHPHWAMADTTSIGPGEELAWTAKWGDVTAGDSTRVTLQRVGSLNR